MIFGFGVETQSLYFGNEQKVTRASKKIFTPVNVPACSFAIVYECLLPVQRCRLLAGAAPNIVSKWWIIVTCVSCNYILGVMVFWYCGIMGLAYYLPAKGPNGLHRHSWPDYRKTIKPPRLNSYR